MDETLLSSVVKFNESSLTGTKLRMLRVIYQIIPLALKVETDERRFINNIRTLGEEGRQPSTEHNAWKVRKHAKKALWLLENDDARSTVVRVFNRKKR